VVPVRGWVSVYVGEGGRRMSGDGGRIDDEGWAG